MSRLPGRGWAALFVTRDGTHYGISSTKRGFVAAVDGVGMVWFRPAGLQPVKISSAIPQPQSRVPVFSQVSIVSHNVDWWIADHLSEDRFDGAEVTVWREVGGTLGSVIFAGYVLAQRGVSATDDTVTFQCTDALGYFLPNKTVGGKVTLDRDTFPNLAPAPVVAVTLEAQGSAGSDEIVRVGIATNHGFARSLPYAGPWPVGPQRISGLTAGSTTFTVVGRNASNSIIFAGQTTFTVPAYGAVQLWIDPEDVEGEAPAEVSNPAEGQAIPVIFGQYANGEFYVPCMVYDWMQANANLCKYVYEDLQDADGAVMKTRTAGNGDVIIIDTAPPTEDPNGEPIDNPWTYTSDKDSIERGQFRYLRKDGVDKLPGGLIAWHAPGGPGSKFGTFDLNVSVLTGWMREVFNKPDFTFDPSRFHILTQSGGAQTNDATVLAAFAPDAYRIMGEILRALVEHGKVPAAKLDLDAAAELQDLGLPKWRRYITSGESVAELYAALCQEARLLPFIRSDGKVSWKRTSLNAPPPAAFRFSEANVIGRTMNLGSQAWGDYFNAANGVTEQGLPYQINDGKISIEERTNAAAIAANDDGKISTTITFKGLYDRDEMRACVDEYLSVQGLPSDVYTVTVHGLEPGPTPIETDLDAQFSVVPGDTLEPSYIASRTDREMRRLLATGSLALCLAVEHSPEDDLSTLTFWKFGATAAASQSLMLIMDGTEEFPAELGGGLIGDTWDEGWSDAKKAWAANYGSGVGGWISDDDEHISTDDSSAYNTSLME